MRPLKFRAWQEGPKVMLDWLCICQSAFNVLSVAEQRSIDYSFVPLMYSVFTNSLGDLHLMQFTGLLDSQGVEIYEGDIVRSGMTGADYIIFWSEENSAWHKQTIGINVKDRPIYSDANSRVIGNIHQNPELLK